MQVEPLCDGNRAAALGLLERFEETSLFLLGNLAEHGPVLGPALTSGNFKCVVDDGQVVAVFGLSRNGNLCLQSDRQRDYSRLILDACAQEPIEAVRCHRRLRAGRSTAHGARAALPALPRHVQLEGRLVGVGPDGATRSCRHIQLR